MYRNAWFLNIKSLVVLCECRSVCVVEVSVILVSTQRDSDVLISIMVDRPLGWIRF